MHLSLLTVMPVASLERYSHPMVKDNPLFSHEINIYMVEKVVSLLL